MGGGFVRLLGVIIVGVFLVTYVWGVLVRVVDGTMTMKGYNAYYIHETRENISYVGELASKKFQAFSKPVRRGKFDAENL
jgi:hypothetical protein